MARPNKSGREYTGKGTSKAERGETMSFFIGFDTRDQRRHLDRLARHYEMPKRRVIIALIEQAYALVGKTVKDPAAALDRALTETAGKAAAE